MTTATLVDQICQFFGGAYDSTTHTYHTPTVAGLGAVRRGRSKRDDEADYFGTRISEVPGTKSGCMMLVHLPGGNDHRISLPAYQGTRKDHTTVELHCFIWSKEPLAEDAQDYVYALRDAIRARIASDVALGSGGIEVGGFQVGEPSEDGGVHGIEWDATLPTVMGNEGMKCTLHFRFEAHSYFQA
jgi:hypothetical protein